jgi:hypothetical protein
MQCTTVLHHACMYACTTCLDRNESITAFFILDFYLGLVLWESIGLRRARKGRDLDMDRIWMRGSRREGLCHAVYGLD